MMRTLLTGLLALTFCVSAIAEDDTAKKKKKGPKRAPQAGKLFELPESIELNDEQKEQMAKLRKEFAPKLQEAYGMMRSAVPAETRKARAKAMKEAREAGKKGKELREAVMAAVPLSDGQQEKVDAAQKKIGELRMAVREGMKDILTKEQFKQLPKMRGSQGDKKKSAKKGEGKKKDRKKDDE